VSSKSSQSAGHPWEDRELPRCWSEIQEWFELTCEHDARSRAGRWAISRLRELLGEDWLPRAVARDRGGYPLALLQLGSHLLALAEALEWALRLEISMGLEGRAKALRDLRRDPSPRRLLHSRAQLLLAGLACRLGWPAALETRREDQPPADVEIAAPTGSLNVEVRVLTQSDDARAKRAAADRTSDWLFALGCEQGVWIGGNLDRHPTESERNEIERIVEDNASIVHAGMPVELSMPGIDLELSPRGAANQSLRGPAVKEDLFWRMVEAIAEKANKMRRSGAGWLHLTTLTGLWAFTSWAQSPLEEQLAVMTTALEEALGDNKPDGIVLCSAAGMNQSGIKSESVTTKNGIALRRAINPVRVRGTLIMSFNPNGRAALPSWQTLADTEADWLDWALNNRCLPSVADLLAPSPV
jgi:hypothetical protein